MTADSIETREEHACFGGRIGFYRHASRETGTTMGFAVYLPPQAERGPVPALYYLAGLTCTEETFVIKAGAQRLAAEHGLALVACDTSPRGLGYAGEDDAYDFGTGAGFYLDATAEPWSSGYRMASYVDRELPAVVETHFPVLPDRRGIFGHSMGGHGALVTALRAPERWTSVSAFAPIANPVAVPWGEKAFSNYLGDDIDAWKQWDASELMRTRPRADTILVDQGEADQFLAEQLHPEALEAAAGASGQKLTLRRHPGYDHSYWFIQSFVADHIAYHARALVA
ncbi:S-formylglutathione hydrolase [Algiphilus sp.]|uniref:S-formylglutathione hydrolase n=1 Tax=Algiphilus sp. TaxID=1872431 RepID=UPI0025B8430E|nr:S-formylglutathione hydrolase [Algiphilus sp.]MCK5770396.1 S-formylglutathione hydrolase [Algiphilus sp.]